MPRLFSLCAALLLVAHAGSVLAGEENTPAHVPFKIVLRLPTVQASVSGKPADLIVDLGGFAPLALTTAALATLPVTFTGQSLRWRDASGEDFVARIFTTDKLSMGDFTEKNVKGAEFTFPPGDNSHSQVGYIGFGLLKQYLVVFDYQKSELRIYPAGDTKAMQAECGKDSFRIDVVNGVVESKIMTDHGQLIFQWDTGSAENVVRPSVVGLGPKAFQDGQSFPFSEFKIGTQDFGRIRIPLREFVAPDVDGVLGTDFFESRVVCIDPSVYLAAVKPDAP